MSMVEPNLMIGLKLTSDCFGSCTTVLIRLCSVISVKWNSIDVTMQKILVEMFEKSNISYLMLLAIP